MDEREREVLRLLDRYLVEVIEAYNFCPWARMARLKGEISREIVWGQPGVPELRAAAERALARPNAKVIMVVAPELGGGLPALRDLRGILSNQMTEVGIAEFHPEAPLDLESPARLVRFLRRAPDPMLQVVPIAILDSLRTGDRRVIDREELAAVLAGAPLEIEVDIADRIADTNHATVRAGDVAARVEATYAAIAADRAETYARLGITAPSARTAARPS